MTKSDNSAAPSNPETVPRRNWLNWLTFWITWGKLRRETPLPEDIRRDIGLPPLPRSSQDPMRWWK
jgi:hypothetical protein